MNRNNQNQLALEDWTQKKHPLPSPRKISNPMKSIKSAATTGARNIKKNIDNQKEERKKKGSEFIDVKSKPLPQIPQIEPAESSPKLIKAKEKKKKLRRVGRRKKELLQTNSGRLRRLTESSLEIKRVLETPPDYERSHETQLVSISNSS